MPLKHLHNLLSEQVPAIDAWFAKRWQDLRPLPYFSCDIRHASFKIGIVDTNLFPAGFNNLCNAFTRDTAKAFDVYFSEHFPNAKRVLILGENHTRNKFYLLNILRLKELIESGGRECRVTLPIGAYPQARITLPLDETASLVIDECKVVDGLPTVADGFQADVVISNNDFSAGLPEGWQDVTTPIVPPPRLGWHNRTKSRHFELLKEIVTGFCRDFDLDPWRLLPETRVVENVAADSLTGLAATVEAVLQTVRDKYAAEGITETPYAFIKNDSGTYGLGIVTVASGTEVLSLNRKKREKLFSAKTGNQTNRFLVQEGIPTHDTYSGFPIEPVIYGVGRNSVGGFFRLHEGKNPFESLNAPGMSFSCLCLHKLDEPHEAYFINCKDKQRLVTCAKFLARFAALAAATEAAV